MNCSVVDLLYEIDKSLLIFMFTWTVSYVAIVKRVIGELELFV